MSSGMSVAGAVAAQVSQVQQAAGQAGLKISIQKDQEMVAMLQKAQADLEAVTPTRGNQINLSV